MIVRSARRTLAVTVTGDGDVVVRAPRRLAEHHILDAVHERAAWIARTRAKMLERAAGRQPELTAAELAEARVRFAERLQACWEVFAPPGESLPELRIRAMRTRWGSLSPAGRVCLNAYLVRASEACLDYVVYHELCHLRVRGHGPAFYAELERYVPDWRSLKRHLRNLNL